MNVLSLFDGLSGAQIALNRAGIKYKNYYASEVDKYAIQVTQKNYPNTIQIGDVKKVNIFNVPDIDLLIGGSPCQGFSLAGKQLNFEDERSKLFFEFVRILKELAPKYFLLENVKMKKEYQDVISKYLGVEPININSNLVSAQNRNRFYWTNIQGVKQPEDKRLVLRNIVEQGFVDREKAYCIDANYYKTSETNPDRYLRKSARQIVFKCGIERGRRLFNGKYLSRNFREGYRIYCENGKSATLTAQSKGGLGGYSGLYEIMNDIRKLTPVECERLQTIPDNYTDGVSNTQRYKMIGNGFTVDVIAHILEGIKQKTP